MGCNTKGCGCGKSETYIAPRKITILPSPEIREKGWGYELIIHDGDDYCGKILHFNEGGKFSLHHHVEKKETWYISKGIFNLTTINPDTAEEVELIIQTGDVVEVHRGIVHQLYSECGGEVFEVSTPDNIDDSYRIKKGDSQNGSMG